MGKDPVAAHYKIRRHVPAVAEADAGHVGAVALDAGDLYAEMDANARRGVALLKILRDFRGHRARHDAGSELDHIHLEALGPGGGGEFQADKSCTDHNDTLSGRDPLPQRLALVE